MRPIILGALEQLPRRELVLMDGKYFASHFDIIFKILGQLILPEWIRKRATELLALFILCMSLYIVEYGELGFVHFL